MPVGRLDELRDESGRRYRFVYVRGSREAQDWGFRPYLAFPELERAYLSPTLFPFFSNRVMPTTRPDYPAYVEALGLPAGPADPLDVLERSNGHRQTDRVEIIAEPVRDPASGDYVTHLLVRGVRHVEGAEARVLHLRTGERLAAIAEPDNPSNPLAVRLRAAPLGAPLAEAANGGDVGYVPHYLTADLRQLAAHAVVPRVTVVRVNPPPASVHHRVLCRLEAAWPEGFRPFAHERFLPLAEDLRQERRRAAPDEGENGGVALASPARWRSGP